VSYRATRWTALGLGVFAGLAIGLLYTWVLYPVEIANTDPAMMRSDYRQDWVRLVALSYVVDGDLERARSRLAGLEHDDIAISMQLLIEEYAAAGRPAETLRRLAVMAQAMDVYTPAMLVYLQNPTRVVLPTATPTSSSTPSPTPSHTPTPTRRPTATPTVTPSVSPSPVGSPLSTATPSPSPTPTATPSPSPTPTATPTPTPGPPYQLIGRELLCEPDQVPHIAVVIEDEGGNGVPGVEVWLLWDGGADRAVTGLKPADGAGYADFGAEADISYTVAVGELGRPLISGLSIADCTADAGEEPLTGAWRILVLHQPVEIE
jgi:hypothetical protein